MAHAAQLSAIDKAFGSVTALDGAQLSLDSGEVHALLGENGAGKTTLARILGGLTKPDRGSVSIDGDVVRLGSAADARALGVAMVHQHFSLVPRFTGLENVALATPAAWTSRGRPVPGFREAVAARAAELGLPVELDEAVETLGVGQRQRLEILKALMSETRVLILDEPTAVLTPQEVDGLFSVIRALADRGTAVLLVAHKLDEVLSIADRVTVLRGGRWIMSEAAEGLTGPDLAEAMIGRAEAPNDAARESVGVTDTVVAELKNVSLGSGERQRLESVSLSVRRGEVLGVVGVEGNGQRELAEVLAGVRVPDAGSVETPALVGWIPQDRTHEGLVGGFSLTENMAFALYDDPDYRNGPFLDWAAVRSATEAVISDLDVRTTGPDTRAQTLSGGNQQKVLTGREFLRSRDLLIAESPTRGLDVSATRAVRRRITHLAHGTGSESGSERPGVVLISTDLDEILELSDRIAVMVRGQLVPVPEGERSPQAIGRLMLSATGASP